MRRNTVSILLASMATFAIGIVFGATLQERHDSQGLRELQGRLEEMAERLQTKNKYVEITEEGSR